MTTKIEPGPYSDTFPDGTTWTADPETLTIESDGAGTAPAGSWTFPNLSDFMVAWVTVITH